LGCHSERSEESLGALLLRMTNKIVFQRPARLPRLMAAMACAVLLIR
jgi:hypothetical protein